MKKIIFILLLSIFTHINAQTEKEVISQEELSLSDQFDLLYKDSGSYQNYKVVKIVKYNHLKQNVVDSLNTFKKIIKEKEATIQSNFKEIKTYKKQLVNLNKKLETSILEKNRRSILGIGIDKNILSVIVILLYVSLIILLGFFAFKYKQNLGTTKKAVSNLQNLKDEFEEHKKTSLKRIKETNRKLQDELNKKWKKEK